jgi:phosphoesterase RecJ-like protein
MAYETNSSIDSLADALRGAARVLVTTHQKPDGDAMGSVLAVVRACRAVGVRAEGWMVGPCEGNLRLFTGDDAVVVVDPRNPTLPDGDFDLAAVVDTGAWTQLEILAPWLRAMGERVIGLDHHARGDAVAARRVVDVGCGSCTALLIRLVDAMKVDLSFGADARGRYSIAEALYLGLATDTGWFRFPNARAAEFALASRLLAAGVDKDAMYQQIEQSSRAGRVLLQGRALSSLAFAAGGTIAVMRLRAADFTETGADMEESSGVVNMPMEVSAVRASVLAVEDAANGVIKLSFRSKPAGPDGRFVDVNELAGRFGGGGHVHAAGARQKGTLEEVVARVRAAVEA